jgi:hypothetical protein
LGDKQTNSVNTSNNLRNIIALQDLGEGNYPNSDNEVVVLDPSTGDVQ